MSSPLPSVGDADLARSPHLVEAAGAAAAEVAQLLLARGADANAGFPWDGRSPAFTALTGGRPANAGHDDTAYLELLYSTPTAG